MVFRDGRRVFVEQWLPVVGGVVWQVREIQISRFFGLVLFRRIGGVHDGEERVESQRWSG